MKLPPSLVALALPTLHAMAGGSAHYSLEPITLDHGGARATSTHYSAEFSAAPGNAGASTTYASRSGYAGQLIDPSALLLTAPANTLNEGATLQLTADLLFDDATTAPLAATEISWSVSSGPLAGINPNGLATAKLVYEDTLATAQGDYASFSDTLDLTVLNTDPDNFGSYAGDGLDDDWQVLYFGEDNPDAAPFLDPDRDDQNNHFEFVAGLVPTDAQSVFSWQVGPVPGQPGQARIIFDPLVSGRTYTVQTNATLAPGLWTPLTGASTSDNGNERTVTDPNATPSEKFYRVEITKP